MLRILLTLIFCIFLFAFSGISQVANYKYSTARNIVDRIAVAYGSNIKPPKLEIRSKNSSGKKNGLMYYPGEQPMIVLDEEVYDLCIGFVKDSSNALAALLGHELAHHYEKHDWCSSFAFLLGDENELVKSLKKISKEEKEKVETQADYYGGFYAYVAGFQSYEITPKLLDAIYSHFKLPEKIPGYPSKTERKDIAAKRMEELKTWTALFDAAEFSFALKEYQKAATISDFLAVKFPSREMFNNSGVCKLLMAVEYFDAKEFTFMMPIEFDTQTRLKNGSVRAIGIEPTEKIRLRNQWLEEAKTLFDKAIQSDPDYLNAKINKACVFILQNNNEMAIGLANEILNNSKYAIDNYNISKAYTLIGIANHRNSKNEEAKQSFEKANTLNKTTQTNYNLGAAKELDKGYWDSFTDYLYGFFEGESTSANPEKSFNPLTEKIGGVNPSEITYSESRNTIKIPDNPMAAINFSSDNKQGTFIISQKNEDLNSISAKTSYLLKTAQGISIGASSEIVKSKYGEPSYTIRVINGNYLMYKKSRIAFFVNDKQVVEKWFIFNRN